MACGYQEVLMEAANTKFEQRFHAMDQILLASGNTLQAVTPAEMDAAWEAAKRGEEQRL